MPFRPKESLKKARGLEDAGDKLGASTQYAVLSVYYRRKGRTADALKMITRAMQLAPTHARLWVQRAICESAAGSAANGKEWIERYAAQAVEKQAIDNHRSYLERQATDFPELLTVFQAALPRAVSPSLTLQSLDSPPAKITPPLELKDLILQLEAELELEEKKHSRELEEIIERFRQGSRSMIQGHPKTLVDLACAFYEMGRFKEAEAELLAVSPESELYAEARCLLGGVLLEAGKNLEALREIQESIRCSEPGAPIHREGLYQAARAFYRLGDAEEALRRLDELQKWDPGYRESQALRRELSGAGKKAR